MSEALKVVSPIDGSVVGTLPTQDVPAVDAAYSKLSAAQPAWAERPAVERGELLRTAAQSLREAASELGELLVREIGKTPKEAVDEVVRSADMIDFTVDQAISSPRLTDYEIPAEEFPGTPPGRVQTVTRVPLGVVLAIAPFNYPVNLAVSKIAPALMMGNTVLFKPPSQGGVAGRRMVELFYAAGLPEDALAVITGRSSVIGERLVTHPAMAMVSLTGSNQTGEQIAKQAGMVPLMMELGGNDPAIVLADADLKLAAENVAKGAFKYAGQRCTAVKRVYVVETVAEEFTNLLVAQVGEHFGSAGDPREHPVGPVIDDKQADYLAELLADATAAGGTVRSGGNRDGRVFEATVIDGLDHSARLVAEEQFGPLLPVVRVKDAAEAVRLANDTPYGLQASVFTADVPLAESLARQIKAGGVHLNGPDQRGPDNFMFVGHKASGLTPQGVRFALEGMSTLKGIVHNPSA